MNRTVFYFVPSCLRGFVPFLCLVSISAAPAPTGLSGLDENALYTELADRGLNDLLQRAMNTDGAGAQQRAVIASMSSLDHLQNDKNLTDDQRQALLDNVVAGLDHILQTLHGDPVLIVKEARVIAEQGVDPLTGLLEYWGSSDVEKNRLRPLAEAALKMYDQAGQLAAARANDLANRITSPDDKLADQWRQMSEIASAANYQKARMQYALALAMDAGDPQRGPLIDAALKAFAAWDNADSQIQPQVRLLIAKLHALNGDKDEITVALKILDSIIENPNNDISPAPSPEIVFEAECFKVIAELAAGDVAAANSALDQAGAYQEDHFPNDRDQTAALRLLRFRLLAMAADQSPPGQRKDAANAAAVQALTQLVRDFPNLRSAIFQQLAARLPAQPDMTRLDPMLLLALVDQGRQSIVAADASGSPVGAVKLNESTDAAKEILRRLATGDFPRAQAVEPSFLLGIFEQYQGDPFAAASTLLDHIERFGNDPQAHAGIALDRARSIIAQLRDSSPDDPRVQRLEDRFLPMAINPPFNRHEFALQYAASLFARSQWLAAIKYYRLVPDTEPPGRLLVARYGEMVALKSLLEQTPHLDSARKQRWINAIESLAQNVNSLAQQVIDSSAPQAEKTRARSTLARMTLIAADITRRQNSDPRRVLQLLSGFEEKVSGLPDAKSLVSGALFLRVQAYMQLGRDNDATQTLVKYLSTTTANEGAQTVHDLLATLNAQLDEARQQGAGESEIRQLADNRAMLSGFLVKWAAQSNDPKIHSYAYVYRRFDADTKRLAAELETDPAARQRDLTDAMRLYKQLQSPQNVALYQQSLEPGADKNYPDPLVTLGIGLIAYDQGDCHTVVSTLGRLIQDEKLGENNDQYWEAAYKLLDCMHTLAKSGDRSITDAQVAQSLKVLYLIWRDQTGGPKYHEKFEALRREVLPNWSPPQSVK